MCQAFWQSDSVLVYQLNQSPTVENHFGSILIAQFVWFNPGREKPTILRFISGLEQVNL